MAAAAAPPSRETLRVFKGDDGKIRVVDDTPTIITVLKSELDKRVEPGQPVYAMEHDQANKTYSLELRDPKAGMEALDRLVKTYDTIGKAFTEAVARHKKSKE